MNECEEILLNTTKGLLQFFKSLNVQHDFELILTSEWSSTFKLVVKWLKNNSLSDKKSVINHFIREIPQLVPYAHLLQQSLHVHEPMWDAVFINLVKCQHILSQIKS